ncbi:MAG: CRISPR system precrRNA processing endoribonuclease RAMP protein Cas6 [Armatimonadota bacterium]|nr:CRISPR system precrRNA processing endoribonuclease RAMP protein Cas6 [Armatimonadota bacterium]
MLAAVDLRLYPKSDVELPHPCAHLVYAAVLDAVRSVDPALSKALHADVQTKPIAVSTMWSRVRATGDSLSIPKYTECRVRICTLTKVVFEALSEAIFPMVASYGEIRLGGSTFVLLSAGFEQPYGGTADYSDLLQRSRREVMLRFTSPVTFRRSGVNVPLPEPTLVYQSLWQKWQAFSDVPISESVFEQMVRAMAVNALDGHTRVWKFPRYKMTGFVGVVGYELVNKVSEDAARLFSGLSELAFYSGVGYKTTMGMGQCRLIDSESHVIGSEGSEDAPGAELDGRSVR